MSYSYAQPAFSLSGKTALITGASSGLGRHFAHTLCRAGARVVVTARRSDNLRELLTEIRDINPDSLAVSMDVTDSQSVEFCFGSLAAQDVVADIIINNAGLAVMKPTLSQSERDWDSVIDTNLKGAWLVATEAARTLVDVGKPGCIVNIASILGERVAGGIAPYAISKAGLLQATKALALDLARYDIRVNALLPGYILTDLNREFLTSDAGEKMRKSIPRRRFGEMSDLDGPLLLLTSDAGRALTGSCLAVDHGHLVSTL